MEKLKILSGDQLVDKGNQKNNVKLPELGIKDVFRNGSWLEQKQIQAALEARKDIVEIERIEKSGVLSQANWDTQLGLAEVTHKTGGHWYYLGHSKDNKTYLFPEEALFLVEVNCLLLKHNDVKVSLQEAYSLLLQSSVKLLQYKVYASLSRLGYRVMRHVTLDCKESNPSDYEMKINDPLCEETSTEKNVTNTNSIDTIENVNDFINNDTKNKSEDSESKLEIETNGKNSSEVISNGCNNTEEEKHVTQEESQQIESGAMDTVSEGIDNLEQNIKEPEFSTTDTCEEVTDTYTSNNISVISHHNKIMQLRNRRIKAPMKCPHYLDSIPDLYQKRKVSIKAPSEQFIPKNVFLNLTDYVLNLDSINTKPSNVEQQTCSRTYYMSDEVSGPHVRRIRSSQAETPNPTPQTFTSLPRFQHYIPQYRPFNSFNYWRPRQNFYQFQFLFQRPFLSRFQIPPIPPLVFMRFNNPNARPQSQAVNIRKRTRDDPRKRHLKNVMDLVARLKRLFESGNRNENNTAALNKLINTYNIRYKTKLRLTNNFELVDDSIVDTIELDDDESPPKKMRQDTNFNDFNDNLNALRELALVLKDLDAKRQTNSRHKRALINAIRTFNKSYNAEVFMTTNYEILDQKHITLASSSDSDCVIEETQDKHSGKKLKNPFNILKRLSEKRSSLSVSSQNEGLTASSSKIAEYPTSLTETFNKNWLPDCNEFGRAEVVTKSQLIDPSLEHINGEYLLDFFISNPHKFENWLDLKLSFVESVHDTIQAASRAFQSKPVLGGVYPIVKSEDCSDMRTVLKKLSIIKNYSEAVETSLKVDFDVYNRDVQFKKSNRPKPNFMIVCVDESSNFPPGAEIAALQSKYDPNATILFAIVGIGSVQYLQITPFNIPVYLSKETS